MYADLEERIARLERRDTETRLAWLEAQYLQTQQTVLRISRLVAKLSGVSDAELAAEEQRVLAELRERGLPPL
jgi:hypothetical protein